MKAKYHEEIVIAVTKNADKLPTHNAQIGYA